MLFIFSVKCNEAKAVFRNDQLWLRPSAGEENKMSVHTQPERRVERKKTVTWVHGVQACSSHSETVALGQHLWPGRRHEDSSFLYLWSKRSVIHFLLILVDGVSCGWKFLILCAVSIYSSTIVVKTLIFELLLHLSKKSAVYICGSVSGLCSTDLFVYFGVHTVLITAAS